jgi:prepilin-type processing-associated H-X9-DG protein
MHNYVDAHKKFPPGQKRFTTSGKDLAWSAFFLSFIEEGTLEKTIDYKKPLTDPVNINAIKTLIPIYLCPSTARRHISRGDDNRIQDGSVYNEAGCIDYAGVSGVSYHSAFKNPATGMQYAEYPASSNATNNGVLLYSNVPVDSRQIAPKRISDGLSKTFLVCEITGRGITSGNIRGVWAGGQNVISVPKNPPTSGAPFPHINPPDPDLAAWSSTANSSLFSDHPAGANVLLCDGSAHFFTDDTDLAVVTGMATRNGGEMVAKP